jgi:two-component system cell cycle sensor histidine kinase PleC
MLAGVLGKSKTDSMLNEYAARVGDAVLRQRARLAEHKARIEIELAKRVKSEFLANMSHELRTPLNTVIGFSKLLSDHGKQKLTDAQIVQYAELIRDAGDHLLSVINDILDITKIQSGAYALESNEVDLIDVLHSCTESVRAAADIAGITLRENIAFNLPPVRGDDAKLAQVFKNLLNNAIKFTLKDGEVVLKAFRQGDGGVIVSVRDNGIGMTDEEARVAVLPFGQVDGGRTRLREGTGLGLPIAKSLVELHGGKLLITSVKGRGTEITVRLPPRDQVSVAEGRDAVYGRGPSA